MNLNPLAVILWCICSIVGYFIAGFNGALVGLSLSMGLSFIVSAIEIWTK